MKNLSLQAICKLFDEPKDGIEDNLTITGVSTDSRTIKPQQLFVALEGSSFDGHNYLENAIKKGAAGLLVSKPVQTTKAIPIIRVPDTLQGLGKIASLYRQQFNLKVAAITGSCGKTTIKQMLSSILGQQHKTLATEKNYNNEIGVPMTLLNLSRDHKFAVIEMGAKRSGDIAYLMRLAKPDTALISCANNSHVGVFGSLEKIVKTKGEIITNLPINGTAILNRDDNNFSTWQAMAKDRRIITFGKSSDEISCHDIVHGLNSISFTMTTDIGSMKVRLPVVGEHNISNALGAAALARSFNIPLKDIKNGLECFQSPAGRLEFSKGIHGERIINDTYNASYASTKIAISVLGKFPGKKIFVFGGMVDLGEESNYFHKEVGKLANNHEIQIVFAFGNLAKSLKESYNHEFHFYKKEDKALLIKNLLAILDNSTTVLIKGPRIMQMEEIVMALSKG